MKADIHPLIKGTPAVKLEPIGTGFALTQAPLELLCDRLMADASVFEASAVLHPLWSQYLRETSYGRRYADRRLIRQSQAIALFGSPAAIRKWAWRFTKTVDLSQEYLPEYISLILEYTWPGIFTGLSRTDITPGDRITRGSLNW